jgi:hypothetical protein
MRAFLIAIACSAAACGSLTDLEGVYTIDTWTQNSTACDVEGPSVAAINDPNFYIKIENFLGHEFVNVVECADVATCAAEAGDDETLHLGGWAFEDGSDDDGWRETTAFAFDMNGTCTGSVRDTVMTSPASNTVRIESRERDTQPFPATGGDCSDEDTLAAAEGQPCTTFEVTTATYTQGI